MLGDTGPLLGVAHMFDPDAVAEDHAIIATILQLAMSFALGWIGKQLGIATGFFLLALMYAGATLSASRARALLR